MQLIQILMMFMLTKLPLFEIYSNSVSVNIESSFCFRQSVYICLYLVLSAYLSVFFYVSVCLFICLFLCISPSLFHSLTISPPPSFPPRPKYPPEVSDHNFNDVPLS